MKSERFEQKIKNKQSSRAFGIPEEIVIIEQNLFEQLHCCPDPAAIHSFCYAILCFGVPNHPVNENNFHLGSAIQLDKTPTQLTFASRNSITCTRNSEDCLLKSISFFSYASLILINFCRSISCAFKCVLKLLKIDCDQYTRTRHKIRQIKLTLKI